MKKAKYNLSIYLCISMHNAHWMRHAPCTMHILHCTLQVAHCITQWNKKKSGNENDEWLKVILLKRRRKNKIKHNTAQNQRYIDGYTSNILVHGTHNIFLSSSYDLVPTASHSLYLSCYILCDLFRKKKNAIPKKPKTQQELNHLWKYEILFEKSHKERRRQRELQSMGTEASRKTKISTINFEENEKSDRETKYNFMKNLWIWTEKWRNESETRRKN